MTSWTVDAVWTAWSFAHWISRGSSRIESFTGSGDSWGAVLSFGILRLPVFRFLLATVGLLAFLRSAGTRRTEGSRVHRSDLHHSAVGQGQHRERAGRDLAAASVAGEEAGDPRAQRRTARVDQLHDGARRYTEAASGARVETHEAAAVGVQIAHRAQPDVWAGRARGVAGRAGARLVHGTVAPDHAVLPRGGHRRDVAFGQVRGYARRVPIERVAEAAAARAFHQDDVVALQREAADLAGQG